MPGVQTGHTEIVRYLIETGHCDPNCKDNGGKTPLYYATERGPIKYLIETGHCDPNCKDNGGKTPLHYALLVPSKIT